MLIEAFNALIDEGIFPKSADTEVRRDYEAWMDRKGHYDDYIMKLVRVYYRLLKGKRADRVETTIDSAMGDRVVKFMILASPSENRLPTGIDTS